MVQPILAPTVLGLRQRSISAHTPRIKEAAPNTNSTRFVRSMRFSIVVASSSEAPDATRRRHPALQTPVPTVAHIEAPMSERCRRSLVEILWLVSTIGGCSMVYQGEGLMKDQNAFLDSVEMVAGHCWES